MNTNIQPSNTPPSAIEIGSISTGTLRLPDLIDAGIFALRELRPNHPLIAEWDDYLDTPYGNLEEAYLWEELYDALNDCCPPGVYFGSLPGDDADVGFWREEDE